MQRAAILRMQPLRFMSMQQRAALLRMQPARFLSIQPTQRLMRPVPKEDQGAHTISQRLRKLKNIPAELIPLGLVVAVAIFAAIFSLIRKLMTDKTLRLHRQGKQH